MTYPPEFIARVKAAYPQEPLMWHFAKSNDPRLGSMMIRKRGDAITDGEFYVFAYGGDVDTKLAIQIQAIELENRRKSLFSDWQKTDIAKKNGYGAK